MERKNAKKLTSPLGTGTHVKNAISNKGTTLQKVLGLKGKQTVIGK